MTDRHGIKADELLSGGAFGIERENLRITEDGRLSQTADPFYGEEFITRDFSENQAELNTPPAGTVREAYGILECLTRRMYSVLLSSDEPEYLWPFSNPPFIGGCDEIVPAVFTGDKAGETLYREYLAGKYGKYRMAFSGIHVNFSLPEEPVRALCGNRDNLHEFRDRLYLDMAAMASVCGWLVMLLTAASPVADAGFSEAVGAGAGAFSGRASLRCSDAGYWNSFVPVMDYTDMNSYAGSVNRYIRSGSIYRASELYIPVRIKPDGSYSAENLIRSGAGHLEFRMTDLNPFEPLGMAYSDLEFMHLFFLWCCFQHQYEYSSGAGMHAIENFRNAAFYDSDRRDIVLPDGRTADLRSAGNEIFDSLEQFFKGCSGAETVICSTRERFDCHGKRYAAMVLDQFGDCYQKAGLELAVRYGREIIRK